MRGRFAHAYDAISGSLHNCSTSKGIIQIRTYLGWHGLCTRIAVADNTFLYNNCGRYAIHRISCTSIGRNNVK